MSNIEITGITISVEFGFEQEYSRGTRSFESIQGKYPAPVTLDETLNDGLDMYFSAWKTLLASRCATNAISGQEFKEQLRTVEERVEKIRKFLKKESNGRQAAAE